MAKSKRENAFVEIESCINASEVNIRDLADAIEDLGAAFKFFHSTFVELCRNEEFVKQCIQAYRDSVVNWNNKHIRKTQMEDFVLAAQALGIDKPIIKEAVKLLYSKNPKKT